MKEQQQTVNKEKLDRLRRQNKALCSMPWCPIFEPSLDEFSNISFEDYVSAAEKMIDPNIGCFKV